MSSGQKCTLLTGPLHYLLQVFLLFVSVAALYLKNVWENKTGRSSRSFFQFFCDSFKQLVGAAWMHVLNLVFAKVFESWMTFKVADECNWYWIEIMIDTTLGVFIEYWLLQTLISLKSYGGCFDYLAEQVIQARSLKEPEALGNNQQPLLEETSMTQAFKHTDVFKYILQVLVWLFIVTCMKLTMILAMIIFAPQLNTVASFVLSPVADMRGDFYDIELLMVMSVTPAVMDAIQLILQDNIFLDIDTGSILEYKNVPEVDSKLRPGFRLTVTEATNEVADWKKANTYLKMEVRALRFELDYAKTGFIARIITMSFRGAMKDGQPGVYRIMKDTRIYTEQEGNFVRAENPDAKRNIEQGQMVEVTEFASIDRESKELTGKIAETAMNPAGWIVIVDQNGRHNARFVAPPAAVAS